MAPLERLTAVDGNGSRDRPSGWWANYEWSLKASSLSPTAREVIELDSRYILDSGILGSGPPSLSSWPDSRHRTGLVMGAVQSGKTASMLGVTALALDSGIDIVVILAGSRLALWRQTYDRALSQLRPHESALVFPSFEKMKSIELTGLGPNDLFQVQRARVTRAVDEGMPLVLIVMKHGQHLRAAATMLHERVFPRFTSRDKPVHMLILDDEADDGSILDAKVENELDPTRAVFKQIPRHIVDLWSTREGAPKSVNERLFATYVGYTATPQANFLQADVNPLAPRDFVAALRTSGPHGSVDPRDSTYREPLGISHFYTGGDVFYAGPASRNDLVVTEESVLTAPEIDFSESRELWVGEALRCYLVAGAVRLWRSNGPKSYDALVGGCFESSSSALAMMPAPHSMLVHPSALVDDHFDAAAEVLAWGTSLSQKQARAALDQGQRNLDANFLRSEIEANEQAWSIWVQRFEKSALMLTERFADGVKWKVPNHNDWEDIRLLLEREILPNVRIAVVNSDPMADDRPEFAPVSTSEGWRAPRDLLTVFVAGNVMSRGLTLEGLTTTLFLRSSGDPLADTQMQMQRWFGYRGAYLDLCRIFMSTYQSRLFAQYNEADEALRRQIVSAMNSCGATAPVPQIIEGLRFRSTGKIAGVSKVPLSPGPNPLVNVVNSPGDEDPNLSLVSRVFAGPSSDVVVEGTLRGRILNEPISLEQAASILDGLVYSDYAPDNLDPLVTRWNSIESMIGLDRDAHNPLMPLFRPGLGSSTAQSVRLPPARCPYRCLSAAVVVRT